jgi:hypothetical protein
MTSSIRSVYMRQLQQGLRLGNGKPGRRNGGCK